MNRQDGSLPENTANAAEPSPAEEAPPFLGSWRRVYLAVTFYLAALILLFYLFTRMFSA